MDEKKFDVIYRKTGREHMVQCKECGAKSPVLFVGTPLDTWCDNHKCEEEDKPVENVPDAKKAEGPAPGSKLEKAPAPEPEPEPEPEEDPEPTPEDPPADDEEADEEEDDEEEEEEDEE